MTKRTHSGWWTRMSLAALAGTLVLAVFGSGCGNEGVSPDVSGVLAPEGTSEATGFAMQPPSLDQLTAKLELTDEQVQRIAPPLDDWRAAARDATPGRRGDGRLSHALDFLAESADVLDRDQMVALVELMTERMAERRDQIRDRMKDRFRGRDGRGPRGKDCPDCPDGPRGPRGKFGKWLDDLDLSEEQMAQFQKAREEMHEAMQALREKHGDDIRGNESFRAEAGEIHEAFRAAVSEILTPQQQDAIESGRVEKFAEHLSRRLAEVEARHEKILAIATKVLDLSAEQQSALSALFAEHVQELRSVLDGVSGGSLELADAHQALATSREEMRAGLESILTAEQLELFDSFRRILGGGFGPGQRGGFGPGRGHHGGGFGDGPGHVRGFRR